MLVLQHRHGFGHQDLRPHSSQILGILKVSNFVVGIAVPRLSGDALSRHHSVEVFPVEKEMSNI